MGAELIGWREKRKPRGKTGTGPIRTGMGMALHHLGRRRPSGQASLLHDQPGWLGRAQDGHPGPRHRRPDDPGDHRRRDPRPPADRHHQQHRQLHVPARPGLGRLDHDARRWRPPCYDAVTKARDALFKKIAPALQRQARGPVAQGWTALGRGQASDVLERRLPQARRLADLRDRLRSSRGSRSTGVGGCQFAEVAVDIETGVVKVKKIVAIQDSGLILDKLTWESQVYGGVIMGLNYGLFEEVVVNPTTGRMLNPDMEWYKLAGASDIPEIIVRAYERPRR